MDIPSPNRSGSASTTEIAPRLRNLHPSHLSPDHQSQYLYGAVSQENGAIPERLSGSSFTERIGSFVGSYSRTSLMFMAENLTVPGSGQLVTVLLSSMSSDLLLTRWKLSSWMKRKIDSPCSLMVPYPGKGAWTI